MKRLKKLHRKKLLTASIAACLAMSAAANAQAVYQPSTPDIQNNVSAVPQPPLLAAADPQAAGGGTAQSDEELGTIEVIGIRDSLKKSLQKKRDADAIIESITAEDIGKFPATNVAEALAQVPGVTIDRALGATQRVSIDGTDPSLNLSFLDGHPVAQAIWQYGDSPNRGFNFSLLAPEVLGSLEIYKSPEARLPEGSIGGTIIMHTIQPLDVPANVFSGSVGYNFNDMVDKGKPDASLFYSWKNDDKTFGIDLSAQHYEQVTNRQGMEVFGYDPASAYAATNPAVAAQIAAGTIKATDLVPEEFNAANFQQTEKRDSFFGNVQWKPVDQLDVDLGLMYMRDNLDNYNQSMYPYLHWTPSTVAGVTGFTEGSGGTVAGGHSCDPHDEPTCPGIGGVIFDNNARTALVKTRGGDLRAKWQGDGWSLSGQAGVSTSHDDLTQAFIEPVYFGGYSWDLTKGFSFDNPARANNPANWAGYYFNGNYAKEPYAAKDNYSQLDFAYDFNSFFNQLLVGVRFAKHAESQELDVYSGGVQGGTLADVGAGGLTDLSGLDSMDFLPGSVHHVQPRNGSTVINWVLGSPNLFNSQYLYLPYFYENTFHVDQKSDAGYAQLNFGNDEWKGNVGVRYVRTDIDATGYVSNSTFTQNTLTTTPNNHTNYLPSFNLAWNVATDVVLRGAASEVIAWAPYNQEVPYVVTNDTVLTGAGGNAHLDPYKSDNYNLSAEWYFAPESVLAGSVFYKDIKNYIVQGVRTERLFDSLFKTSPTEFSQILGGNCDQTTGYCDFSISRPQDGGQAKAKGYTINYQQPFADTGFGLRANYTYSDASTQSGGALPYNSKNSFNVTPYYEKGDWTASVTYGFRSSYLAGGYVAGAPAETIDAYTEVDANVAWKFSDHFSVSLDGLNLLDSTYFGYLGTKYEPVGKYKFGREYMATLHFKF